MFENLSDQDISRALEEMIAGLGIREDIPHADFATYIDSRDLKGIAQQVAKYLGLPIRIQISYIPSGIKAGSDRFVTSALARTDWTGRGIEGITTQVSVPSSLPMYGTQSLKEFPIHVRVSENCARHPYTYTAIMAHEMSHVLLAAMYSPYKDSELHTDLTPIILGFRTLVRHGRQISESTSSGKTTTKQTTTYGYLTDKQFEYASHYVYKLLQEYIKQKKNLVGLIQKAEATVNKAKKTLKMFRDYFSYLDRHPSHRMLNEHALRMVNLHGEDHTIIWEEKITKARSSILDAKTFGHNLVLYTSAAIRQLEFHSNLMINICETLDHLVEEISTDTQIMNKYIGIFHRLWYKLMRN
jgi:hypothetical protein